MSMGEDKLTPALAAEAWRATPMTCMTCMACMTRMTRMICTTCMTCMTRMTRMTRLSRVTGVIALVMMVGGVTGFSGSTAWAAPAQPDQAQPDQPQSLSAETPQPPEDRNIIPITLPDVRPEVLRLIDSDYLSAQERAALRVRHGIWTDEDVSSVPLKAAAAIISGDDLHPALTGSAAGASVEDVAEAKLRAGQLQAAITLVESASSVRAHRIAGQALIELGRNDLAIERLRLGSARAQGDEAVTDGDELAEAVYCSLLLARLQSPGAEGSLDYQLMLTLLAKARDEYSRLAWKPLLVEALLLYEKDKYGDAVKVIQDLLSLNPRCAAAWDLFGQICVDTFDFERAERIAARLDLLAPSGPSVSAACIRAYIRIRQGEGDEALKQLEPVLAALPASRRVLAYQAAATAAKFDFAATDALIASFDIISPRSPLAVLRVGRAMADSRQYEEAAKYLERAVKLAPNWVEPLISLGNSQFQAGLGEEAAAALEAALAIDPLNNSAANSVLLLKELATYATIEGEHFIIRCKPGIDEVVAGEMLEPLEAIYARVTGNGPGGIDHKPTAKTVLELYPNHRWFGVRITGMPALHTIAAATGPVIAMEAPRDGAGHMGSFDWRRVVQHEYTHTVTLSRTKNRLPHWFTEASAVFLEDAPRDYNTIRLLTLAYANNRIFDLDTINIMFVRPKRPTDRSQAYAQGHLMYEFMISAHGPSAPLALMDLYARGVREEAAFTQVLGMGRVAFMARFKEYMGAQLALWGMVPTAAHPNLKQLLAQAASAKQPVAPDPPAPNTPATTTQKTDPGEPTKLIEPEKPANLDSREEPVTPAPGEKVAEGLDPPAKMAKLLPAPDDEAPEATMEQLQAWHIAQPANPFVLDELVQRNLKASGGNATDENLQLLRDYAAARPVNPAPHKLMAKYFLAIAAASDTAQNRASAASSAVTHLEYLDAREQSSPRYALELARQYAAAGQMEAALKKVTRAAQIAPYDAALREDAATLAIRAKDLNAAKRHIVALTKLEPDRPMHVKRLEAINKLLSK